jgi:toxin FitB
MYLLDTNIVSKARRGSRKIAIWLKSVDVNSLFLSVISIGEIARGIAIRERKDSREAEILPLWLNNLRADLQDRILPVTEQVALERGKVAAIRTRDDADGLIAATALVRGLTLVTRNVRDFADTGVTLVNPRDQA